jgi:hypothetical protein
MPQNVPKKFELRPQKLELGMNFARPSAIWARQIGPPGNSLLNLSTMSYLPAFAGDARLVTEGKQAAIRWR